MNLFCQTKRHIFNRILIAGFLALFAATAAEAAWVYDSTAKTLSNDDWSFATTKKETVGGVQGLRVYGAITRKDGSSSTTIDFTTCATDSGCGYPVVAFDTTVGSSVPCTRFIAPDMTQLNGSFDGNTTIEEVQVSPNATTISHFAKASNLKKFTPTNLPLLTGAGKDCFSTCTLLEGDFTFGKLAALNCGKMFMSCAKVTSVSFPEATSIGYGTQHGAGYMFSGMTSLTNFYAPKVAEISSAMCIWSGCKALKTLTLSSAVDFPDGIGSSTFSDCSLLTSFPNLTFPTATSVGGGAFNNCGITGKLNVPNAMSIGDSAFNGCKLSEIYAPKAATIGSSNGNTFRNCANLEKLTLGSVCSTDGKTPKKGIYTLKSTGSDIYLAGNTAPTAFNDTCWMQPSTAALKTMNARVWMKTGADSMWAAWKTQFSGVSGFVEAKDFTSDYTGATYYPGDDVTLGCFNNLNGGYAWICEWGEYDAVVNCPVGVQVTAFRADGETVEPSQDGSYHIMNTATVEIDYATLNGYLFADGTSTASATGLKAAKSYAAGVCPKAAVACEAKIGDALYLTLQEAFAAGGSVTLLKSIAPASVLTVAADKAVVLALNGFTITASGTIFDVAGSLTVSGDGIVHGTAFAGAGSVRLAGGTYDFDVSDYCIPGFLSEQQTTEPPTWKVVPNTDVAKLNVNVSDLDAAHIGVLELDFAGAYTCVTNEGVITFTLPKNSPFSLVFKAAQSCRFVEAEVMEKERTKSYADGIASDTTLAAAEIPVATAYPAWTLDTTTPSQGYLVCGDIRLKVTTTQDDRTKAYSYVVTKTSKAGDSYTGLEISGVSALGESTIVDFTLAVDAADADVISLMDGAFKNATITSVIAPHVVYIGSNVFYGNKTIGSVTVSPNLYTIGGRAFRETPSFTNLTPSVLAKLESFAGDNYNFYQSAVAGDFTFDRITVFPGNCFNGCTNLLSVVATNCERVLGSALGGCSSLTNFYGPRVVDISAGAFQNGRKLEKVVFSTAITNLGASAFYGCSSLVSLPEANWTNLVAFGASNFDKLPCALGDVRVPLLTSLCGRCFNDSTLTSCYAPKAEALGELAFKGCSLLTNVTIKGSAGCFTADTILSGVPAMIDLNWLGYVAPTNLHTSSLAGGTSEKPLVVRVKSGKDLDGWRALCTKKRAEMETDESVAAYRLLAKQCGLRWGRVVGYIGGAVKISENAVTKKDEASADADAKSNRCWIYNDGPKGFTVIVR